MLMVLQLMLAEAQDKEYEFRWGLLVEYSMDVKPVVSGLVSDKFVISAGGSLDGYRAGVFLQQQPNRGYWREELAYFKGTTFVSFLNLKVQEDLDAYGHADIQGGPSCLHRNIELSVLRGFNLFKRFSLVGGFTCGLQFKEDLDGWSPDPTRPMDSAIYSLSANYNKLIMFANVGVDYQFGPLTLYVQWKPSLTSVSAGIDYEGTLYPVNYKLQIWSLGVNYFPLYKSK